MDETTCEQPSTDTKQIKVVRCSLHTPKERDNVMPIVNWKESDLNDNVIQYQSKNRTS